MTILFILVPVAPGVVLIGVGAFMWATRKGQLDDLGAPALRVLRQRPFLLPPRWAQMFLWLSQLRRLCREQLRRVPMAAWQ